MQLLLTQLHLLAMCTSASQQTFPLLSFSFVTMHYPSQYPFSILTHSVIVSYCSLLGSAVLCNCHLAWENFKHATAQASICLHLKHFLWSRIQDVSSFAIGTGAVKDELFTLLTCATPWERDYSHWTTGAQKPPTWSDSSNTTSAAIWTQLPFTSELCIYICRSYCSAHSWEV